MLERLARFVVRRRRLVLLGAVLFLVVAGAIGGSVAQHLQSGGFEDPGASRPSATELLDDASAAATPTWCSSVTAKDGTRGRGRRRRRRRQLTERLATGSGVDLAVSYWTLGIAPAAQEQDGRPGDGVRSLHGAEDEVDDRVES